MCVLWVRGCSLLLDTDGGKPCYGSLRECEHEQGNFQTSNAFIRAGKVRLSSDQPILNHY